MFLTREQILSTNDLKTIEIEVPQWGGKMLMREMSCGDRALFTQEQERIEASGEKNPMHLFFWAVVNSVVDQGGARVFEMSDAESFNSKSQSVMMLLGDKFLELNGLKQGSIEDAEKN